MALCLLSSALSPESWILYPVSCALCVLIYSLLQQRAPPPIPFCFYCWINLDYIPFYYPVSFAQCPVSWILLLESWILFLVPFVLIHCDVCYSREASPPSQYTSLSCVLCTMSCVLCPESCEVRLKSWILFLLPSVLIPCLLQQRSQPPSHFLILCPSLSVLCPESCYWNPVSCAFCPHPLWCLLQPRSQPPIPLPFSSRLQLPIFFIIRVHLPASSPVIDSKEVLTIDAAWRTAIGCQQETRNGDDSRNIFSSGSGCC